MFSGHSFNHEDFLHEEKQQDNDTHVGITKKEKINTQYAQSKTEWQHKTNSPDSEIWLQCQHKKAKELMAQWRSWPKNLAGAWFTSILNGANAIEQCMSKIYLV